MSLKIAVFVLALVAASFAQPTEPRSILDMIIKNALESVRPKLKDLEIPRQELEVHVTEAKIAASLDNGRAKNLDKFVITKIATSAIPLKVKNLTVVLDELKITGNYKLNGSVDVPIFTNEILIFGDGDATVELKGIFFTIAADFVFEQNKFQIPLNGLHGFDMYLQESKVRLENIFGGGNKEELANKLLGFLIPDLVRDYKGLLFEIAKEPMRIMINDFLAGKNPKTVCSGFDGL